MGNMLFWRRRSNTDRTLGEQGTPLQSYPSLLSLPEAEITKPDSKKKKTRLLLITQDSNITTAPTISIIKEQYSTMMLEVKRNKKVKFFNFKGLIASAFTCFDPDNDSNLYLRSINKYAKWLKSQNISAVLVNGVTGEGPVLNIEERKLHVEAWWTASLKYDLVLMVQVGGAPLPDVIELTQHADSLGVHAIMCLPELLYKPRNVKELVSYCKRVAKHCSSRPFFYCHYPKFTHVYLDMSDFCDKAEQVIMNFFGIEHVSADLDMGARCLREGRVILLGRSTMLSSAMLLGFDSALLTIINIRPDLVWAIYDAMKEGDILLAGRLQIELNTLISFETCSIDAQNWFRAMKVWFNREMLNLDIDGFYVGPTRRLF